MTIATRAFVEALLLGTSGTTRTIAAGRFHLVAPDKDSDSQPANVTERAIDVTVGPPSYPFGWNGMDGFVVQTQPLTVRVTYLLTDAGGDMVEALSEQAGAGTRNEIADRAATDAHAINVVLQWHENYDGSDPRIITINPESPSAEPVFSGDRATMTLPFTITSQATLPGTSYSP